MLGRKAFEKLEDKTKKNLRKFKRINIKYCPSDKITQSIGGVCELIGAALLKTGALLDFKLYMDSMLSPQIRQTGSHWKEYG